MTSLSEDLSDVARKVRELTEFIRQCQAKDVSDADCAELRELVKELDAFVRARQALRTPSSKRERD
jgi:hypothetical protein